MLTDEERATAASDGVDAPASGSERHFDRFWYQRSFFQLGRRAAAAVEGDSAGRNGSILTFTLRNWNSLVLILLTSAVGRTRFHTWRDQRGVVDVRAVNRDLSLWRRLSKTLRQGGSEEFTEEKERNKNIPE